MWSATGLGDSVLGPALWNVAYDSLLQMKVPHGVHLVGFADDLVVIGVARTGKLLEDAVNLVLRSGAHPPYKRGSNHVQEMDIHPPSLDGR